jgi:hypothetical protein
MSLIIAKQDNLGIYIVADTKLSYAEPENHPKQAVASPGEGVIKATLINPHVCVCFAGDVSGVDDLLRMCRGANDFLWILNALEAFHRSCDQQTEFIVAVSHHPLYRIYEIKDGRLTESKSSWIGSKPGFSQFQEYLATEANSPTSLDYKMGRALGMVMQSSIDPTVNGFLISVTSRDKMLYYHTGMSIAIVPQVVQGNHTIGHGSPQKGGYSIHYFPPSSDLRVLPIHVLQGNLGIVYKAVKSGLLWPEVIRNIDERAFSALLLSKYGIVGMGIGPRLEDLR